MYDSFNAVLNDAFRLYRKYILFVWLKVLVDCIGTIILLILFVSFWVLHHSSSGIPARNFYHSLGTELVHLHEFLWYPTFVFGTFVFVVLFCSLLVFTHTSLTWIIDQKEKNYSPRLQEIMNQSRKRFFPVIIISSISALLTLLMQSSFLPLTIIGIILSIMISQAYYFVLLENQKIFVALRSSNHLTHGHRLLIYFIWVAVLGYAPAIVGYAIWRALTKL